MTITFIIIQSLILLVMCILMVQLLRAKNAFRSMLIKFVNLNQSFYETQKILVSKFSGLIISLDRSITETHDISNKNKMDFESQSQLMKDCLSKILILNKKIESYSVEVHTLYGQLAKRPPAPAPAQQPAKSKG